MTRIQVLHLPSQDDGPPRFGLVVDQADGDDAMREELRRFGEEVGAAGVLVTDRTVTVPADQFGLVFDPTNVPQWLQQALGQPATKPDVSTADARAQKVWGQRGGEQR